jgi:UDP-N-acetylmuramoylalanine--D-glutamate ligase
MGENMSTKPFSYPEGCFFNSIDDIKGKNITVMGLGLNGGGEATVKFLVKHGANVLITDMKNADQLRPTLNSIINDTTIDSSKIKYVLGEHRMQDFAEADCVIKNPGVKIENNRYLLSSKAIETDISMFLHFTKSPIIAITGSKGKSSTVSAIHYGLNKAGFKSFLGGNITVSPLTFLDQTTEETPVVLELSSWQLADLRGRKALKPKIAVITKIVPDHQNWYDTMGSYVADKRLIYADQTENDFTIIDADGDPFGTGPLEGGTWGELFAKETKAKVIRYSQNELSPNAIGSWFSKDEEGNFCAFTRLPGFSKPEKVLGFVKVPGNHNKANLLNAATVMALMNVEPSKIESILGEWNGIPHRLQYFHTYKNKFKFYNDSCSTVPESAAAASQAFGKSITLITGGTDKGLSFEPLSETLACKKIGASPVQELYLLAGTGTDKLVCLLDDENVKFKGPYNSLVELMQDLKKDIMNPSEPASRSDTIVFSPGATSFGMFSNEFDRGEKFMEITKTIF